MKRYIVVTTEFDGLHSWPEGEPEYLRNPHRHTFTIRAVLGVERNDRELEIITVKNNIEQAVYNNWGPRTRGFVYDLGRRSCEDIAEYIVGWLQKAYGDRYCTVEVMEDGRLGAMVQS